MKKKLLALLLALSCTLSVTACSSSDDDTSNVPVKDAFAEEAQDESAEEEKETETVDEETVTEPETVSETKEVSKEDKEPATAKDTPSVPMPAALSDDIYDFQVSVNGTVYQFPMWYSDFEALGWTFEGDNTQTLASNEYSYTESWTKDGVSLYTSIANLSLNSAPYTECMVASINFEKYNMEGANWEILLPGGIQYGVSNADDIKAAYGTPSSDYDSEYYYQMEYSLDIYQSVTFYVYKESNTLEKLEIRNMVELEGADNSIDPTVPAIVSEYKAPASLGDDFYSFNVELEGNLYTLPCPATAMIENGFTIVENNSDMEIGAGATGWVEFRYNNQSLRAMVKNFADYATIAENCFVLNLEADDYFSEFELVIPGNIKVGDSEDKVKAAVADFNCEVETSDSGYTYYEVRHPDASILDGYEIVVEEGVVTRIDVTNYELSE